MEPQGEVRFGFPNHSDNAEIVELIRCGVHLTLFTTGRGKSEGLGHQEFILTYKSFTAKGPACLPIKTPIQPRPA